MTSGRMTPQDDRKAAPRSLQANPYGLIFLAGVTGLLAWVLFALIAMG